jgi:hypothetical protein
VSVELEDETRAAARIQTEVPGLVPAVVGAIAYLQHVPRIRALVCLLALRVPADHRMLYPVLDGEKRHRMREACVDTPVPEYEQSLSGAPLQHGSV